MLRYNIYILCILLIILLIIIWSPHGILLFLFSCLQIVTAVTITYMLIVCFHCFCSFILKDITARVNVPQYTLSQ